MGTTPVAAIASGQLTDVDLVREALKGEYEVLEELGRGGMALVYRARDLALEREIAVKVLPFSLAFDAEFVERFQREARTSAQLEHPNIVPIYRVGQSGRVIYFTMKYLRGGSLSTVLNERQKLTPPEIRRLLIEAGSALGYAAQRGIVHRDIKPDNIMFDEFGQVMLTDFGIAKAASGQKLTGTGMSIGTPHYMSPEQARAQAIDGRSDIYSLGVVAFQCLAGVVPYDGDDSFSIGYKHITEAIPIPPLTSPDERRLFEVIKRMLMKDPNDRFQACEELVGTLRGQPTAASGGVHGRPSGLAAPAAQGGGSPAVQAPAIAEQPTAPIDAAGIDRRRPDPERRATGRRVADRSLAMRDQSRTPWLWGAVAAVAIAGGSIYYFSSRGFAPAGGGAAAPAAVAAPSLDSLKRDTARLAARADSTLRGTDSSARGTTNGVAPAAPNDSAAPPVATPPVAAPPVVHDSGALRVLGLPPGSVVTLDERPVSDPVSRLPAGAHVLGVSAPRFQFYLDTVHVAANETLQVHPALTRLGAVPAPPQPRPAKVDCDAPGSDYNANGACFDARPVPKDATFVPVPPDADGTPKPSVLWVKVSAGGATLDLRPVAPSNDPAFERDVREFARAVTWRPASKRGQPVTAWTQWKFDPRQ